MNGEKGKKKLSVISTKKLNVISSKFMFWCVLIAYSAISIRRDIKLSRRKSIAEVCYNYVSLGEDR